MGRSRTDRSDLRRFGLALAGSAIGFLILGLFLGEDVALKLQETPTTTNGWLFVGWLIGGPPFALTVLVWLERKRLPKRTRQVWSIVLGAWIGLSAFVLPARLRGMDDQFGTGALIGNPLSAGWVWGIFATGLIAFLAGISVLVASVTVKSREELEQLRGPRTRRILEGVWMLALVVSLGLALYGGNGSGIFNNGN